MSTLLRIRLLDRSIPDVLEKGNTTPQGLGFADQVEVAVLMDVQNHPATLRSIPASDALLLLAAGIGIL